MLLRPRRLSVTVLAAAGLALASASVADAATMTRQFASTGAAQAFDVPPSVTSLAVTAVGGRGGGSSGPVGGGFGARVEATLTVTPGQRLWIAVGGNGGGDCADGTFNGGAPGGSGWCGNRGGAGGGASDVRVCAPGAECPDLDPDADPLGRLLVAGGGGGAGRWANDMAGVGGDAGAGGGTVSGVRGAGGGGGGGTATEGGVPGVNGDTPTPPYAPSPASPGTLGAGGIGATGNAGANTGGGGGGGGLYGGGGGGSANYYAGGGGGGSNLVPVGGDAATDSTGTPGVTLTWEVGDPATIDRPTVAKPTVYADGTATTTVTVIVRDADENPVSGADVSFSATAPQPAIGPVTDNGDGSYSATVTAASSRGATQITARLAAPDRTSEPVTLTQIDRPAVTSPDNATPVIGRAGQSARISVSGTADPLTTSVDVRCVTAQGVPQLGGADAVPVVDGRWSVTDASLPSVDDHGPQCRLVAVADGQTETRTSAPPGPRLRRLEISEWKPRGSTVAAWVIAGGLDGEARLNTFGSGCGVSLEQVRPDLTTSIFWLSCGAGLSSYSETIDGDPALLIDGKRAYTAALLEDLSGAAGELPPVTVDATVTADGSFLVTERSPTRRCAQTDAWPTGAADCGALTDTGVTTVVRSRIAPSGATVSRRIDFESTDDRAHDVRMTLESSTYYLLSPEVLAGGESDWRTPQYGERSADLGPAYSVLFRRANSTTVPTTAVTAVPGPTTQILDRLTLVQRYLRSVPAGAAAGVAMTFDMVPRDDAEAAAAASRRGYDVAVAIDAPASGTTTEAESVTVSGTASDQAGATQLRVAGQRVAVDDDGRWTATVPLSVGENPIEAVVESRYGPRETASVTVSRTTPARPTDPDPPTTPADPTPPSGPTPPGGGTPPGTPTTPTPTATTPQLLRQVTTPKRIRLAQIRKRGLSIPVTLTSARTRITAELRGPWGAFARTTRTQAKSGRTTLRITPTKKTLARATKALKRSKSAKLRLTLTVRDAADVSQTVTRTIQLRR